VKISEHDGAITFDVRVIPRSSKSEIVGEIDGVIKIKLKAPPVDGAANEELVKLLSKLIGVSKSAVEITNGKSGRTKRLRIIGINTKTLREALDK